MGKSPVCFLRLKRSSAAAATHFPFMVRAAAESWPCEMRYSRSSKPGHCARRKGMEFSSPLMPMMFIMSVHSSLVLRSCDEFSNALNGAKVIQIQVDNVQGQAK